MTDSKFTYRATVRDHFLLGVLALLAAFAIGSAIYLGVRGDTRLRFQVPALLFTGGALGVAIWYLRGIRYKLRVSADGIKVKVKSAFVNRKRAIDWDEIRSAHPTTTAPAAMKAGSNLALIEDGVYSLDGRTGLDLRLTSGERVFIGCRKVDELAATVRQFV